jgi:hypothetical protein
MSIDKAEEDVWAGELVYTVGGASGYKKNRVQLGVSEDTCTCERDMRMGKRHARGSDKNCKRRGSAFMGNLVSFSSGQSDMAACNIRFKLM